MIDTQHLIEKWLEGDENSARLLYDQNRDRVYRLAYGLLGNAQDAEEVAQDALTYALVNIDRYDAGRAKFSTWLHTITVSRSRDKHRRKRFSLTSLTEWMQQGEDFADNTPSPENQLDSAMHATLVMQAVDQLKPQLREALILRYWAGHSFAEMAKIMGCPLGTAQSRVRRAFEQLRKQLTPQQLAQLGEGLL